PVELTSFESPRPIPPRHRDDELGRRIEAVQLGALLGVQRNLGSEVIARVAWLWIEDPLSHGRNIGWSDTRSGPAFMPALLDSNDRRLLGRFCAAIATHRRPNIDIA